MRGNDQNFNMGINNPIEDVVWKTWYAVLTNSWGELNAITIRRFADGSHCRIKSQQVSRAESNLAGLVVGYMLKVLNAGGFVKEVTHLSKALACRRTSSAGMRLDKPLSISAARCAAS